MTNFKALALTALTALTTLAPVAQAVPEGTMLRDNPAYHQLRQTVQQYNDAIDAGYGALICQKVREYMGVANFLIEDGYRMEDVVGNTKEQNGWYRRQKTCGKNGYPTTIIAYTPTVTSGNAELDAALDNIGNGNAFQLGLAKTRCERQNGTWSFSTNTCYAWDYQGNVPF